jgi:predicted  nucleic acid-binding Zn-ribbon protein
MDTATAAAIATIIGALAAVIRWLLQVWYKQQAEIEKMREGIVEKSIRDLERAVDDHKKTLVLTTTELKELKEQMTRVASVGVKVEQKWTGLSDRLEQYVKQNQERVDKLHGELLTIGKELYLLKGNPRAAKDSKD